MPDLVTHVAIAHLLNKPLRISKCETVFFAGTVLPDVLTRPFSIVIPESYWFVYPLHTPLVLVLVCLLISYFFEQKIRKAIFRALLLGVFLHLVLDLFQSHLVGVNYWLFPFSDINVEIGLFWQDDSIYAIPILLALIIIIESRLLIKRMKDHKYINGNYTCQSIAHPEHKKI